MKLGRNWGRLGMKSEWIKKKLSDIADFNPRETIKKGTIAKKISMDVLRPFCRDIPYYTEESFSGGTKFRNGDTIMARITPCLENGKTAQVSILNDGEVGFGSTEYIVFRAKEGIADKEYLFYLVCSPEVREPAIKSMVGSSGRQRVQTDVVKNLEIEVPPLAEQEAIGSFLKLIDDKIALNDRINKNLYEQMLSIFNNARRTSAWNKHKLGDVLIFFDNLRKPLSSIQREKMEHIYPYYGAASIVDYVEDYLFDGTYILISEDGANVIDSFGHPLTQYTYGKFWVNNHAHIVKGSNGYSEALVYAMLGTLNMQSIVTGAAQPKINQANLRNFEAVLPESEEAQVLSELLNPVLQQMLHHDQENEKLSELRDILLPQLMSGALDVSAIDL